ARRDLLERRDQLTGHSEIDHVERRPIERDARDAPGPDAMDVRHEGLPGGGSRRHVHRSRQRRHHGSVARSRVISALLAALAVERSAEATLSLAKWPHEAPGV